MKQARMIAALMHSHSVPAALGMARNAHFAGVRRLLDIGGGSGCFCIAPRGTSPTAALHDHGACRCDRARSPGNHIAAARLGERASTRAPSTCSGRNGREGTTRCSFPNILHDWDFDTCAQLLAKAHAALPDGGRVFIHEALLDDPAQAPRSSPRSAWSCAWHAGASIHVCGVETTAHERRALMISM